MATIPNQQNKVWPVSATDYGVSALEPLLKAGDTYYNTSSKTYRQCIDPSVVPALWFPIAGEFPLPSPTIVAGFDDFEDPQLTGWVIQTRANGSVSQFPSFTAVDLIPGSGLALLEEPNADPNDGVRIIQDGVGLVPDDTTPAVVEFRFLPVGSGTYVDDECEWGIGLSPFGALDATKDALIVLRAEWLDPGGGFVRSYIFGLLGAAEVLLASAAVTFPALGVGEKSYRVRITAGATYAGCEVAIDEGAYSTVAWLYTAPEPAVYAPFVQLDNGNGVAVGGRNIAVDYAQHNGVRAAPAAQAGAAVIVSRTVERPPTTATAPLQLSAGVITIDAATTSLPGSMSAADKTKLDTIEGGADVTDATNVAAALAAAFAISAAAEEEVALYYLSLFGLQITSNPTSAQDAATKIFVDQPPAPTAIAASTGALTSADIGGVRQVSYAGSCTVAVPDLSGSLLSGATILLTLQLTNAAGILTLDPDASVYIDGSTSNFVANGGVAGLARVSLISFDGLHYFSGAA